MIKKFIAIVLILALGGCQSSVDTGVCTEGDICASENDSGNETIKEIPIEKQKEPNTSIQSFSNESNENMESNANITKNPVSEGKEKLIMFHNGKGPMCIKQLEFLEKTKVCDSLEIEKHLTSELSGRQLMNSMITKYDKSIGRSDNFGYLPITFVNGHAYSGFNDLVEKSITTDIEEICN